MFSKLLGGSPSIPQSGSSRGSRGIIRRLGGVNVRQSNLNQQEQQNLEKYQTTARKISEISSQMQQRIKELKEGISHDSSTESDDKEKQFLEKFIESLRKEKEIIQQNITDAIKNECTSAITLETIEEPVTLEQTGRSYEKNSIERVLRAHYPKCPKTGESLDNTNLLSNKKLKQLIQLHEKLKHYDDDTCNEFNKLFFSKATGKSYQAPWLTESGDTIEKPPKRFLKWYINEKEDPRTGAPVDPKTVAIPKVINHTIRTIAIDIDSHRILKKEITKQQKKLSLLESAVTKSLKQLK